MVDNGIRRLPVVIKDKLAGIVTLSDILEARASDATSLNIWELNYLISKLTVREIMTTKVYHVTPDENVETCMTLMTEKKFRHLPVLDNNEKVVGVISIGDLVKAIISKQRGEIHNLRDYISGETYPG